ncbi:MAG: hypothetical protein K0U84_15130 [Actinomycetia bacterium]|nr:hypothetical protein [Actinomycetes bacterium]
MPIQRQVDPLPPGRYYTWQPRKKFKALHAWMRTEGVNTTHSESNKKGEFIIFATDRELTYPKQLGYPDFASAEIQSAADTIERPDPELEPLDQLYENAKAAKRAARQAARGAKRAIKENLSTVAWLTGGAIALTVLVAFAQGNRR